MDNPLLKEFFSSKLEIYHNKCVQGSVSESAAERTIEFVRQLIAIPLKEYVEYILANPSSAIITSLNITQASHIELCKSEMCDAFRKCGYKGMTILEIGKALHNVQEDWACLDKKELNRLSKYGENVKGAAQLGLTLFKTDKWFLSYFGVIYPRLDNGEQNALIARCLLRDPFYAHLFREAIHREVNLHEEMLGLGESTKIRRKTSVLAFCRIVETQANIEGLVMFHPISFEIIKA